MRRAESRQQQSSGHGTLALESEALLYCFKAFSVVLLSCGCGGIRCQFLAADKNKEKQREEVPLGGGVGMNLSSFKMRLLGLDLFLMPLWELRPGMPPMPLPGASQQRWVCFCLCSEYHSTSSAFNPSFTRSGRAQP